MCQSCTTLCTSSLKNFSAVGVCHSLAKTVLHLSVALFGLISSEHFLLPPLFLYKPRRASGRRDPSARQNGNLYYNHTLYEKSIANMLFLPFCPPFSVKNALIHTSWQLYPHFPHGVFYAFYAFLYPRCIFFAPFNRVRAHARHKYIILYINITCKTENCVL